MNEPSFRSPEFHQGSHTASESKPSVERPKPLMIADSKDNLHDPLTLQFSEWNKNLFGFAR
jgi:hypothetical protein